MPSLTVAALTAVRWRFVGIPLKRDSKIIETCQSVQDDYRQLLQHTVVLFQGGVWCAQDTQEAKISDREFIYLSDVLFCVSYFMKLYHRLNNNELEMIWKEVVMA
jgi:hypothetical protein